MKTSMHFNDLLWQSDSYRCSLQDSGDGWALQKLPYRLHEAEAEGGKSGSSASSHIETELISFINGLRQNEGWELDPLYETSATHVNAAIRKASRPYTLVKTFIHFNVILVWTFLQQFVPDCWNVIYFQQDSLICLQFLCYMGDIWTAIFLLKVVLNNVHIMERLVTLTIYTSTSATS